MPSHGKSTSAENYEICKPDRMASGPYRVCSKFCLLRIPPLLHLIFMYSGCVRLLVTGAHLDCSSFAVNLKKPTANTEAGMYLV